MRDAASIREYCLSKPGTSEDTPFDEVTLALRVMGKIFGLLELEGIPTSINLKCDPERAEELRERFDAVQPGYHMNKKHWNTVTVDGTIPPNELKSMIDHSYDMVVKGLRKAERDELATMR
ncbi:MAG: MmcQ/YjbR family DNA-binding protein [bacterium]|nr:MmcQ/YjbR family DNA-binding protein [Candidatus Kapabacteria bacterium]